MYKNQPIRKIGTTNGQALYLIYGEERTLHIGFNATSFTANRKQRTASFSKQARNKAYCKCVKYWQFIGEWIDDTFRLKTIPHFYTDRS